MSEDPDYIYALKLQQQLDESDATASPAKVTPMSDVDKDYELALRLQAAMDAEAADDGDAVDLDGSSILALDMTNKKKNTNNNTNNNNSNNNSNNNKRVRKDPPRRKNKEMEPPNLPPTNYNKYLDQTQNLVHPEWELIDPTPDICAMFVRFDEKFFHHRLGAVVVEWSKKMYTCAGICYQRGNRFVKEVIIRLSEPLLKLRPRKDLVETLLHEMIHAYCFVLNIREGNGGHGPNFKKIMNTINKVAGTNITVYHTFHDEVDAYKTHIWRCNGICQYHNPFQGWVKRTSNRAPGPSDQWWEKHQRQCGGTFEKKSEPKPNGKPVAASAATKSNTAKFKNESNDSSADIRNYFDKPKPTTAVVAPVPAAGVASAFPPTSYPGLSTNPYAGLQVPGASKKKKASDNVIGFKDLTGGYTDDQQQQRDVSGMQGQGYSLTSSTAGGSNSVTSDTVNRNHLRELWSKRFDQQKTKTEPNVNSAEPPSKRSRLSNEVVSWESYDEDVMVRDLVVPVIQISDSEGEEEQPQQKQKPSPAPTSMSSHERTVCIKREVMEDESLYTDAEIIMIDDEYNDDNNELSVAAELADQSIIDDLFGEDTLLKEFQRENDVVPCSSRYQYDEGNDITSCPICFEKMKRSEFANHLEGCSITIRVPPPKSKGKRIFPAPSEINKGYKPSPQPPSTAAGTSRRKSVNKHNLLKSTGYTEAEIAALDLSSSSESNFTSGDELTPRQIRQRGLFKQTSECPRCGQELRGHQVEAHRNICKRKTR